MPTKLKIKRKHKLYNSIADDDCFRVAISNILNIHPRNIPNFVKLYKINFAQEARKWLNKRNKTITFIPFQCFLEADEEKHNNPFFPQGICIAVISRKNSTNHHAVFVDNGNMNDWCDNIDEILGYYIIHNL